MSSSWPVRPLHSNFKAHCAVVTPTMKFDIFKTLISIFQANVLSICFPSFMCSYRSWFFLNLVWINSLFSAARFFCECCCLVWSMCEMFFLWLLFCRDDHGFSPLHWACREGRSNVVDMLIMRGARINVMNRGDDTPLHLAASHGHRDIVGKVGFVCTPESCFIWH